MTPEHIQKMAEELFPIHDSDWLNVIRDQRAAFIQGYQKALEWISVKNGLPEIGVKVLISIENGWNELMGERMLNGWAAYYQDGRHLVKINDVTHWMPLPSPPKNIQQ